MCASFDDLASIHHQDQIGGQDRAQAVGDDDAGAARHHALQCILDQRFGFAVQLLVASSSTRMRGSFRMTRASAMRCFSPPLKR